MLNKPGRGIDLETRKRLSDKSRYLSNPKDFNPDITLIADINAAYYLDECGKIVNVGHSLNSKGRHYTNRAIVLRENLADLVCVPGPFHHNILKKNLVVPVETTGYIKSDLLFKPSGKNRKTFCRTAGINPASKLILFAPTFDFQLSAIPVIKEQIIDLAGPDTHLLIKLHGMTDQKWVDTYKKLSKNNPFCTFISENDITPSLQAADILISDVSSAFLEFMLLNKPIILVNNPLKKQFAHFDSTDIEYKARKACTIVNNFKELKNAVQEAVNYPNKLAEKRKIFSEMLCYGRDGNSAKRTAQAVLKHFNQKFPKRFTVFVPWKHPPAKNELLFFLKHLKDTTQNFDLDIIMAGSSKNLSGYSNTDFHWHECTHLSADILHKAIKNTNIEYIAIVHPNTALPHSWPKFLMSHLHWNENAWLVQSLQQGHDYQNIIDTHFQEYKNAPFARIASQLKIFLIGSALKTDQVTSSCMMFTKTILNKHYEDIERQNIELFLDMLRIKLNENGLHVLKALDIYTYPLECKDNMSLSTHHANKKNYQASIIIPVLNNLDYTINCLESIFKHTDTMNTEIIIVDNGSNKITADYLSQLAKQGFIKIITNASNLGFAKACNQGALAADGEYLVFLNNDTVVTQDWLNMLVQTIKKDPRIGAIGPKLLYPDDTIQHAGIVFTNQKTVMHIYNGFRKEHPAVNKPRNYQALSAACLLIKKKVFVKLGMFDERFKNGFEDVDLCLKIKKLGLTCHYCPQSQVYHYESKTPERFKNNSENEKLLGMKWSQEIECDENLYYAKDSIHPDTLESGNGDISFLLLDSNTNFFWEKAKTQINNGNLNKALEMYNRALQFNPYDPRNFSIMEEMSQLLIKMNLLSQAEECIEKLVKSAPTQARYLELSRIQKKMGKLRKAASSIHKSMELS